MPQYVLGVNLSHDRSACLLEDGQLIVAIEEERLDRIKHSIGRMTHDHGRRLGPKILPWRGITYCLDERGIGLNDVDLIMLDQAGPPIPLEEIAQEVPIRDKSRIRSLPHPSHHLAHAASAYFCSPFSEAAILVADNIGSYLGISEANEGETGYHAQGLHIKEVFKTTSQARDLENDSLCLGRLYRMGTLLLGFYHEKIAAGYLGYLIQYLDEGGKTMGLAPYGKNRKTWPPFVTVKQGELNYTNFFSWLKQAGLFPQKKLTDVTARHEYFIRQIQFRKPQQSITRVHQDLAFAIQHAVEAGLVFFTKRLYEETQCENLCIAGGVGLNSVANKKILDRTPFKNIFVQPAATDDGNAIGAAYYGWHYYLHGTERFHLRHASLGKTYSDEEIERSLIRLGLLDFEKMETEEMLEFVAHALAQSQIVGWHQGGAEFGPRALGNRSILADPRHPQMKDILNQRVKFREGFRPYAPSVLAEYRSEYFEIDCDSPFMLLVAPVKKAKRKLVPAITHVDGSARLQTVTQDDCPLFYRLIQKFHEKTGIPLVLNTSFNIKGEPIVETPTDAILCFLKADMDLLVMGSYVLKKALFRDELFQELVPVPLVKIIADEHKKPRCFYVDIFRQEIKNLAEAEKDFISCCDQQKTVTDVFTAMRIQVNFDLVRLLFRKRLITFKTPFSDDQLLAAPSQDF